MKRETAAVSEDNIELRNILEAALLAAEEPLSLARITALFPEEAAPTADLIKEVLAQLEAEYEGRGIELKRVGKGYRFQSREKYSPWLRKLNEGRPPRYSRAVLETLAIIAYRQPVTRGDIEDIRGVAVSTDIMRLLLDREWIKQVGQRDVPGRPGLFGTTKRFLEYFNLRTLSELPPLIEQRQAEDIARELNLRLPLENDPESEELGQDLDEEPGDDRLERTPGIERPVETAEVIPIDEARGAKDEAGEAS